MTPEFKPMLDLLAYVPEAARLTMVAMYRQSLREQVAQAAAQLAAGDAAALVATVHKLAGSAAMMQDRSLSESARALEKALREGDLAGAAALWPRVEEAALRTLAALAEAFP